MLVPGFPTALTSETIILNSEISISLDFFGYYKIDFTINLESRTLSVH